MISDQYRSDSPGDYQMTEPRSRWEGAFDSFKIRAQNSLKNNYNERKVNRHIDCIDNKISEYEAELDKEFDPFIKDKLVCSHKKKENYQNIKQHLKESVDGQISITDPYAKEVVFQRNSVKVG